MPRPLVCWAVPAAGGVAQGGIAGPEAAHLAHPQRLVRGPGQVPDAAAVIGAVGVDVELCHSVFGFLAVGVPVGHELAGVGLVHRGDDGVGAALRQLSGEQFGHAVLGRRVDQRALLLLRVGGGGLAGGGVDVCAPVAGVGLVEGIDGVHLDPVALFEKFDGVAHVGGELAFRFGQQVLALGGVNLAGDVAALGHEPRWGVAEGFPAGDLLVRGEALHPPALVLIGIGVVGRRIVRVPGLEEGEFVGLGLVDAAVGVVQVRRRPVGFRFSHRLPPALHSAAVIEVVRNIGGIATAYVVAGDVEVEAVLAEDLLVQLLAQLR